MSTSKRWTIRQSNPELERLLVASAKITPLVATLLVARGIDTPEKANKFLNANLMVDLCEPVLLPGCKEVAERLYRAVQENQKIAVYGDYDVDGITGIVILYQTIRDLGGTVSYYIPDRLDEGYGLNSQALEKLAKDNVKVVVTVDCGIGSYDEALTAKQCGIDLLITDHHTIVNHPTSGARLPEAFAIAHPQLIRRNEHWDSPAGYTPEELSSVEKYPCPTLCGATVALKVAWAMGQIAHEGLGKPVTERFRKRLKEMLGLAAMGTVADFVPLKDENRALVRQGLQYLMPPSASIGLQYLFAVATRKTEDKGKPIALTQSRDSKPITPEFVAFQLAPRINAAGRLNRAKFAVELLTTDDPKRAETLAKEIDQLNDDRRAKESEILREAEQQIQERFDSVKDPAFVLKKDGWDRGVIGIVAGRLAERYHRPVILLASNIMDKKDSSKLSGVGSARGVGEFDLHGALTMCEEYLERFGGHKAAAGLAVAEENIDKFREAFCEVVAKEISQEERTAELFVDGFFQLSVFNPPAVRQIFQLAPFGSGNMSPIFAAERVTVHHVRAMGKGEDHFSAEFYQSGISLRGVAFRRSEWIETMKPYSEPMDIVFKVRTNDFNGRVELDILDWRRSGG